MNIRAGEDGAADRLLTLVYEDLKRMAAGYMASERRAGGRSLEAGNDPGSTGLVAEAYLKLVSPDEQGGEPILDFENRRHLFGAAARAMQRILIDHARSVSAAKRGSRMKRVPLDEGAMSCWHPHAEAGAGADVYRKDGDTAEADWPWLEEAIGELEKLDPREAELVRLRFFAGLTEGQAATVLGISDRQLRRDWVHARAWLQDRLERQGRSGEEA